MFSRFLLTILIIVGVYVTYRLLWRYFLQKRASQGIELNQYRKGRPAILYFTTPGCVPCRTIQRPALKLVKAKLGERIQIIEIDALSQPNLADRWGVLSVPTTFIIDEQGRPRGVNSGIVKAEKLIKQLETYSEITLSIDEISGSFEYNLQKEKAGMD